MEKKIVVFDFDKTLINYDTTYSFFRYCARRKPILYLIFPLLFLFKLLSKLNLITVKKEKEINLKVFCPKDFNQFNKICKDFSKILILNEIYTKNFKPLLKIKNIKIVIASASLTCYLEKLFPQEVMLIGSNLNIDNDNKIMGIKEHPFKIEKKNILLKNGIPLIDEFYTDSMNDMEVSKIAKKIFWVRNGNIYKIDENTNI